MDRVSKSLHTEPVPVGDRPLRIVVADDDRDSVLMLSTLLGDEGHDVQGVYNGDAVMPLVAKLEPDVVILDIAMPGRSGYAVARDIAEKYPAQKPTVIAITGKAIDPADQMLSEIVGFDHYLLKPYSPDELLALLKLRMRELRLVAARPPVKPRSLN